MPQYAYALAVGSNQTSLTNIETLISIAPFGKPIPLGSVRRTTLNQNVQTNGTKVVTWFFKALAFADFNTLIEFIFGDFDTENAVVTLDTRGRDELFYRCNAVAQLPLESVDYQRREYGSVEDLTLTFRITAVSGVVDSDILATESGVTLELEDGFILEAE